MGRRSKLTPEDWVRVRAMLTRRRALLEELVSLSTKAIARSCGVSRYTIARFDLTLHGSHARDPLVSHFDGHKS